MAINLRGGFVPGGPRPVPPGYRPDPNRPGDQWRDPYYRRPPATPPPSPPIPPPVLPPPAAPRPDPYAEQKRRSEEEARRSAEYWNQKRATEAQAELARKAAEQQALLTRGTEKERLELQARLQAEAEARRLAALQGLFGGQFPGGGGGGGGGVPPVPPPVTYGTTTTTAGAPAGVLTTSAALGGPSREEAARSAAFGRAKDRSGQIARAALTGLQEQMSERGIRGSGIEALGAAGVFGGAAAPLQDLTREQAIMEANRAAQISDLGYQGGITQRGQDITARGQDVSYQTALRNALMGLFGQLY